MYNNIIIIIILILLYLYECKKEDYTSIIKKEPFIKMNLHSDIAIVSIFSDLNISNYELYSIQNFKLYANFHNYALFIHKIPTNMDLASKSEYKYQAIAKCLEQQYKYVVWMDLNTIFNNKMYCLTKLISPNKNYDIILSNTTPNLLFYSSIIIFCSIVYDILV